MWRKFTVTLLCSMVIISFLVIIIEIAPMVEAPTTIYVDDDYPTEDPTHKKTIQAAIDAAFEGDTVFVYNGTYYENVIVDKTINLIGISKDNTTIDGGGSGDVVNISVDWVNITGFTVTGGNPNIGYSAVELNNVQYCRISHNNITNNYYGICLIYSNWTEISNNSLWENTRGIRLEHSTKNNVSSNIAYQCRTGVGLVFSDENIISTNSISHETNEGDGIYLSSSSRNMIIGNTILKHWQGIYLQHEDHNNTIIDNNCSYNKYGIRLYSSSNNSFKSNIVMSNIINGFLFSTETNNNTIYYNHIINNTLQAEDHGNNQWDNGYPLGGNYWSDYGGVDKFKGPSQNISGGDGIGDTPYTDIDGGAGAEDNYPLMGPYLDFPTENYTILKRGWNLISIPLIQENQSFGKVLEMIDGYYDAVRWYDSSDTNDPWGQTKIGKPFGNDLSELNETMGFWIYITRPGDTIFLYNGTLPTTSQQIQLYKGWNLVGYPSLNNYNRTDGLNNTEFDTHINKIMWYNASSKTWHSMDETDYFQKGVGYWFHIKEDIVWHVPL